MQECAFVPDRKPDTAVKKKGSPVHAGWPLPPIPTIFWIDFRGDRLDKHVHPGGDMGRFADACRSRRLCLRKSLHFTVSNSFWCAMGARPQ